MPVGPFATFGACVAAQRGKGNSAESARRICGALERDTATKRMTTYHRLKLVDGDAPAVVLKRDDLKRQVFGFANVSVSLAGDLITDLQLDQILPEDLEQAAYDFCKLAFSGTGEMHTGGVKGQMIECVYLDTEKVRIMLTAAGNDAADVAKIEMPPRWWVGFELDADSFAKVLDGTFKMFSVQGKATSTPIDGGEKVAA